MKLSNSTFRFVLVRHPHHVVRRPGRRRNLDDALADVVILKPQCLRDHRVHVVHADRVGKFEDFLVRKVLPERVKDAVRDAAAVIDKRIGVGEERALDFAVAVRNLPMRQDRGGGGERVGRGRVASAFLVMGIIKSCWGGLGVTSHLRDV